MKASNGERLRESGLVSVWHEVECGAYSADLEHWEELAREASGPVLDLGCGTGRVSAHLAGLGYEVVGVDVDAELLIAARAWAEAGALGFETVLADVRELSLGRRFALVLGPMQLAQLMGGSEERKRMLARVADHLRPGGRAAFAICEPAGEVAWSAGDAVLPDVQERDGWVYSSLPTSLRQTDDGWVGERLRQAVSPAGELQEELVSIALDRLSADELEAESLEAGLRPAGRRHIPPTPDHVGSTVVVLELPR